MLLLLQLISFFGVAANERNFFSFLVGGAKARRMKSNINFRLEVVIED
jgi:hypothetical protein